MDAKPQRPKRRDSLLPTLDAAIEALGNSKGASRVTPAKAVFSLVRALLTVIRVSPPSPHAC